MTCLGCKYDVEVERAAIQERVVQLDPAPHTCASSPIEVLLISPAVLQSGGPHIGRPFTFETFDMFALFVSRPTFVEPTGDAEADKASAGGLVCGSFKDNRRKKANAIRTRSMSFDFDSTDVETVALSVAGVSAFVHETFKSKDGARRSRLYVELAETIDASTFDTAHRVMRTHFAVAGEEADEAAKDVSRLNYLPVRATGTGYQFRRVHGTPLDVARMLAVQPPPAPKSAPRLAPLPGHRDKYIAAALAKARASVASATPGGRHLALCREAFSLARLGLRVDEIAGALVPAFVAASGEGRRREAERVVRDAVTARGAA